MNPGQGNDFFFVKNGGIPPPQFQGEHDIHIQRREGCSFSVWGVVFLFDVMLLVCYHPFSRYYM